MAITLPTASEANTDSTAANAATIAAAEAAFIAEVTVLINNAVANGFFEVEPYAVPNVSSDYVTSYFTNLGYTVLFPLVPNNYPYTPPVGIPEVLPPGYVEPFSTPQLYYPPRFKISWSS